MGAESSSFNTISMDLGRDYQHSLAMQKLLKNDIGSIDVFLLLFSGAATR